MPRSSFALWTAATVYLAATPDGQSLGVLIQHVPVAGRHAMWQALSLEARTLGLSSSKPGAAYLLCQAAFPDQPEETLRWLATRVVTSEPER